MKKQANKKIALLLTALVCMLSTRAQFLGIRASNFGGITNVNYNPAIADSRYQFIYNGYDYKQQLHRNER